MRVSEGDLRKAITYLQSAVRLNAEREITEKIIIEIAGVSENTCLRKTCILYLNVFHTCSSF